MDKENLDQASILIVDDMPENLQVLMETLRERGYKVRPAPNGNLALRGALSYPPDLILLDINMPEMSGYEVCERLKANEKLKAIPVIFVSGMTEMIDKVKAFSTGGVDYITKPFQREEVLARVETHLKLRKIQIQLEKHNYDLEDMVKEKVKEISESQIAAIFAIAKLSESRDGDTGKHLERTQGFCKLLAAGLGKLPGYQSIITPNYIENIYHASPLHDIGKVAIPDIILLKPERLSCNEFEMMKKHTSIGAETLQAVSRRYPRNSFINMGIAIAKSHHEKWDGGGYPEGLSGPDIPLSARIMAVADVYDALRSKRCYKRPFSHEESCRIILQDSGTHFDPNIVAAFRELHTKFEEIWDNDAE